MRDNPFDRPDVRALLECVAAGDDPAARLVLWDRLEEMGVEPGFVAWCRGLTDTVTLPPGQNAGTLVRLDHRDGGGRIIGVRLRDRVGRRQRPRCEPIGEWPPAWPADGLRLAAALALAADRLAARAAAK